MARASLTSFARFSRSSRALFRFGIVISFVTNSSHTRAPRGAPRCVQIPHAIRGSGNPRKIRRKIRYLANFGETETHPHALALIHVAGAVHVVTVVIAATGAIAAETRLAVAA